MEKIIKLFTYRPPYLQNAPPYKYGQSHHEQQGSKIMTLHPTYYGYKIFGAISLCPVCFNTLNWQEWLY